MQNLYASRKPMNSPGRAGLGRNLLASLIAFALIFSFFHGWAATGEADIAPSFVSASIYEAQSKAPTQNTPAHDDHCLTHLAAWDVQDAVTSPVVFDGTTYKSCDDIWPSGLAAHSPFKPPRV